MTVRELREYLEKLEKKGKGDYKVIGDYGETVEKYKMVEDNTMKEIWL